MLNARCFVLKLPSFLDLSSVTLCCLQKRKLISFPQVAEHTAMMWWMYTPQTNLAKGWSGLAMEHRSCWILSMSLCTDIWNSVEVGGEK